MADDAAPSPARPTLFELLRRAMGEDIPASTKDANDDNEHDSEDGYTT